MRDIKFIGIHCTAGPLHQSVAEILHYWKKTNGWKYPGYHDIILPDGSFQQLLSYEIPSNGVKGFNSNLINICCIGGVDAKGNPVDNRTSEQIETLINRIKFHKKNHPNAVVLGHRDFSTDANGNGIIERWEYIKSCPGYDTRDWLKKTGLETVFKPTGIIYKQNYPLIKDSFVGIIQTALVKAGYPIAIDDFFGSQTHNAILKFQNKMKITASGIADDKTISLLGIR